MTLLLSTFGVAVASALIPLINIEVILAGLAARWGPGGALVLAAAAGVGQTVGKVIWYEASRRGMDSRWMRGRLDKPKRQAAYQRWRHRTEGRPVYAGGVMLAAAFLGLPPLLVMAVVAGVLHMPRVAFVATVLLGRTARFYLILAGVGTFVA